MPEVAHMTEEQRAAYFAYLTAHIVYWRDEYARAIRRGDPTALGLVAQVVRLTNARAQVIDRAVSA